MKFNRFLLCAALCGSAAAAEFPNLIQNGSFEEGVDAKGVPKHWRLQLGTGTEGKVELTEKNATEGKYAVHIVKSNDKGGVTLTQDLRLKPNTDYIMELKGKRNAGNRWHYYGIRMPDCKVRQADKIPTDNRPCPPVRFTTPPDKTLCYVNLSLWGYNDNNKATLGEMWIDEVTLRELPRIAGKLEGMPTYLFPDDEFKGKLFSSAYKGEVVLTLTGENAKVFASTRIDVIPGENSFKFRFSGAPEGTAKFTAATPDGALKLEHPFMIQKKGF